MTSVEVEMSSKQSDFFFSEASRAIAPHAARWRRDALFLSLGDHLEIALPLATVILAARAAKLKCWEWEWAQENDHGAWRCRQTDSSDSHAQRLFPYCYIAPDGSEHFCSEVDAKRRAVDQSFELVKPIEEREQALMRTAVAAAIAKFDGQHVVVRDSLDESVASRSYVLTELLTQLTTDMVASTVQAWPVKDMALKAWVRAKGDVTAIAPTHAVHMRMLIYGYGYGAPHHSIEAERNVKGAAICIKGKPNARPEALSLSPAASTSSPPPFLGDSQRLS